MKSAREADLVAFALFVYLLKSQLRRSYKLISGWSCQ